MTPDERSEKARKAAKARWSRGVRPLPKRVLRRIDRKVASMTPEEHEEALKEFIKGFSGFLNLYRDRPME